MNCKASEALFEGYLDDTLLPAQRAQLLGHLRGCGRCTGVFEELRVVDALLATPRSVELPENFTFATMAEVRSLARPHCSRAPVYAYLVSYVLAAWLLTGAGFLLAPTALRAFFETALDASGQVARTVGMVAHAGARVFDHLGSLGTLLATVLVLDAVLALAIAVGFTVLRPRIAERDETGAHHRTRSARPRSRSRR